MKQGARGGFPVSNLVQTDGAQPGVDTQGYPCSKRGCAQSDSTVVSGEVGSVCEAEGGVGIAKNKSAGECGGRKIARDDHRGWRSGGEAAIESGGCGATFTQGQCAGVVESGSSSDAGIAFQQQGVGTCSSS